ncbi:MAG: ATP-binding cassette domain-containing protein [Acidobacteria bacterium]|nr:ATP-binding cassette domain-containing protein [Acidobacteriota bacterium]
MARFSVIAAASFRILPSINRLVGAYSNFSFNVAPGLALMQTITGSRLLSAVRAHEVTKIASCQLTVGTIQLKDIGFRYPGSVKQVLRSVNAIIGRGERIGVTGPSGSGKSTLIDILAGLYSPSEGAVLVNGRVIAEDLPVWRTMIGYVPQTPFIMPGTIRENVAFDSDSTQSNERIWAVLTAVGLADFAAALPHGIETEIGEKGAGLSGGQKQLLCLARALYRQPRILLLDEPTSSLDRMTEEKVLAALHTLPPDTTIIMVSHDEQNFDQFDFVFTCKDEQLILKKSKRDRTVMQQAAV